MLNLVNQNKQHVIRHIVILQVMTTWRSYIFATYPKHIKNGVSNSYFVKIKTFRLQTSKLLGNRRKTYILDVICNRFYFGEVQEEVLGQCSEQGISAPKEEGLSAYLWSVSQKKQAWWLKKLLCKYSTEVSRFVLETLEKWKFIASVIP